MKAPLLATAALLLFLLGCGGNSRPAANFAPVTDKVVVVAKAPAGGQNDLAAERGQAEEFVAQEPAAGKEGGKEGPKSPAKIARKIKHSADLKLITDEFDKARDELQGLIAKHQGYEALADVQSSPGAQRVGTWRVRVPAESFDAFRTAVRKLAEVEKDTVATEDLTDQYYDLDANIKNLRAEQESWRDMLKRTSDKLENLISVKRELDRVTDEIQRKEGRLRLMANLTDLTTVNISLRERQKFTPDKGPETKETATFGMKAGRTFDDSWGALRDFGQAVALLCIALAPWLPVMVVVGVPVVTTWRHWRRHVRVIAAAPVTPAGSGG